MVKFSVKADEYRNGPVCADKHGALHGYSRSYSHSERSAGGVPLACLGLLRNWNHRGVCHIPEQGKLKNFLAIVGSGIALWGSYVEMDHALAIGDGETKAATMLLAAGLVIYVPFTALALQWRHWVRILIAPMLIAGLAFCVTLVATGVPAILVSVGCNAKPAHIAVLIGVSGFISVVVGVAVFCIAIVLAIRSWREEAKAATRNVNG